MLKPLQDPVRAVVLPFRDTRVAAELADTVHTLAAQPSLAAPVCSAVHAHCLQVVAQLLGSF